MPAYGDLVLLVNPAGKRYVRRLVAGDDLHTNEGVLDAATVAAAAYGGVARTRTGAPFKVMRPTLTEIIMGIKRQTQILYPKDIGYLCLRLGAGPGRTVLEAGAGSGGLTVALSWFSGPTGRVCSYEARPEFARLAARNLAWAGVGENVTLRCRDILDGFEETDADALFLDVREPWRYLEQAQAALKPGAPLAFLVPTVNQANTLLAALEAGPFDDLEMGEILLRRWKPVPDRLRPEDRMTGHTGFLLFARLQTPIPDWDTYAPRPGTRERKQIAARGQRLGAAAQASPAPAGAAGESSGEASGGLDGCVAAAPDGADA